jgi:hypothetical protein
MSLYRGSATARTEADREPPGPVPDAERKCPVAWSPEGVRAATPDAQSVLS